MAHAGQKFTFGLVGGFRCFLGVVQFQGLQLQLLEELGLLQGHGTLTRNLDHGGDFSGMPVPSIMILVHRQKSPEAIALVDARDHIGPHLELLQNAQVTGIQASGIGVYDNAADLGVMGKNPPLLLLEVGILEPGVLTTVPG